MKSPISGKIDDIELKFLSFNGSDTGDCVVEFNEVKYQVQWRLIQNKIQLIFSDSILLLDLGFEYLQEDDESFQNIVPIKQLGSFKSWQGKRFERAGLIGATGDSLTGVKNKRTKIKSQMPGKVVKVMVSPKDRLKKGDPILVIEAMKMENQILAPSNGLVEVVHVKQGQAVEMNQELLVLSNE